MEKKIDVATIIITLLICITLKILSDIRNGDGNNDKPNN